MRKRSLGVAFIFAMALVLGLGMSTAQADTILLPYINSNPGNLSTLVSVINTASNTSLGCGASASISLHYRYFTKPVTAGAADACEERDFWRPTSLGDIVTFDVSGDINGGVPIWEDPTNTTVYTGGGAGAPRFDLPNMGFTDARRGYMTINHRCSNVSDVPGVAGDLDAEVMLLDIVNGAAWGYRASIAIPAAMGNYGFSPNSLTQAVGMTTDLALEGLAPTVIPVGTRNQYTQNQFTAIAPPDEFLTRFVVTPLSMNATVSGFVNNMTDTLNQKWTAVVLRDRDGFIGVTDRDENAASGGAPVVVRCVAGIDLDTLTTGSFGSWFDAFGGWAQVDLMPVSGTAPNGAGTFVAGVSGYNAIVTKVEFGTPSFSAGSMINSNTLLRDGRIW